MPDSTVHEISAADRAKIDALMQVIHFAQNEVAKTLGAYFGFKNATIIDRAPHDPHSGDSCCCSEETDSGDL